MFTSRDVPSDSSETSADWHLNRHFFRLTHVAKNTLRYFGKGRVIGQRHTVVARKPKWVKFMRDGD